MQGFMQAWMDEYSSPKPKTLLLTYDMIEEETKMVQVMWAENQDQNQEVEEFEPRDRVV